MLRGAFLETCSNTGFRHFCDSRCARGGNAAMLCDAPVCCRVQAADRNPRFVAHGLNANLHLLSAKKSAAETGCSADPVGGKLRQAQPDARAAQRRVLDGDLPVMACDECPDDRKAKAGASGLP